MTNPPFQGSGRFPPVHSAGEPTTAPLPSSEPTGAVGPTAVSQGPKQDPLETLDGMLALESVKQVVHSLVELHSLNRERTNRGLPSVPVGLHLVFTGNPGTGKTTVARIVAEIYQDLGLLPSGQLVEVGRADLVAGHVGQTALKVEQVVEQARGGVLFIDEAYALQGGHEGDYGHEAVATLVKKMEDHRNDLAVFVAGYASEMGRFISMNAGLQSRFQRFIDFPDYSDDELVEIFRMMAEAHKIKADDQVLGGVKTLFKNAPPEYRAGNARFARNVFEQAYARMAVRVNEDGVITDEELEAFHLEDVPTITTGEQFRPAGYL